MFKRHLSNLGLGWAAAALVSALSLAGVLGSAGRVEATVTRDGKANLVSGHLICDCTAQSSECHCTTPY
jgi:hypothetical protein